MKRLFCLTLFPLLLSAGTPDTGQDRSGSSDGWFAKDKARHAVIGFVSTGFSVYQLRHGANKRPDEARWTGAIFTLSLGIGKEFKDRTHPDNHFCFKDLAADGIGIAAALLLACTW